MPTLYTCGRFDEATPETTEYYSSLTPNSRFHVFENSAHMPYIGEQAEYLKVIADFLQFIDIYKIFFRDSKIFPVRLSFITLLNIFLVGIVKRM